MLIALMLSACVAGGTPPEPGAVEAADRQLTFTDVTAEAGLSSFRHETGAFGELWFPETNGTGCAFVDFDGDGWQDVLIAGGGVWPETGRDPVPALEAYRNDGDGTFTRVTEQVGLADVHAYGYGIAAADYDNDGDQDVFLSTLRENLLFRNDHSDQGEVEFVEIGSSAGVADHSAWSSSALFFDAERDGDLDLFVTNYVEWTPETDLWCSMDGSTKAYCTPLEYPGVSGRFYRNQGERFRDETETAGFADAPGKELGIVDIDFSNDGWPDLVVASDTERDLLYENQRDGTFEETGMRRGIAFDERGLARSGMGVDAGDVDNSGKVSVAIGHFSNQMLGFYQSNDSYFVDRAAIVGVGHPSLLTLTFGLLLFDADLDGYLDLATANGHISEPGPRAQEGITYRQRPHLFLNHGDGRFSEPEFPAESPFHQQLVGRGIAYGDYDLDGDLDLLLTENGGPVRLWRNDLQDGSYLRVRLEGTESNRDALGSRVVAVVGDERITRRVRIGGSYLSHSEKVVTFGLAGAAAVDSLIVSWPSGRVDQFVNVEGNRQVLLLEGSESLREETPNKPTQDADANV